VEWAPSIALATASVLYWADQDVGTISELVL
jgi:hypothetical protein